MACSGNKIALQTDKPAYVSGETVTGRVFVNLQSPVICEAIVVKMTGYEKAEWEELITEFDSEGNAQVWMLLPCNATTIVSSSLIALGYAAKGEGIQREEGVL